MKIILLGAPGAGKGTYSSRLKNTYNLEHISTGDILRNAIKNKTEHGLKAKEFMEKGLLVPDEIVIELLKDTLKNKEKILIDGFPRNEKQAKMLDEIIPINLVLKFDVREDTVLRRISKRRICKNCGAIYHLVSIPPKKQGFCDKCEGELYQRPDDNEETIKKRLKEYHEQTSPLEKFYKEKGILHEIDANLDMNHPDVRIIEDCQEIINSLLSQLGNQSSED